MKKLIVLLVAMLVIIAGCDKGSTKEASKESKQNKTNQQEKAESVKIKQANIEKDDKNTLKVTTKAVGEKLSYAYYVYKDDKVIEKTSYKENSSFTYTAKEPGTYFVRVYAKDGNNKTDTQNTEKVKVEK
ncbi:triple tyrosine motif-containing protein [Bacillus sp. FSL M7-0996]|uniref:triple tyrosine motif-containing protein n=1 Tax=Bacillus sp. FSL M7-0996 TaxID=2921538 RepID=UPI0030F6D63E